jgi:hypothetical protein
MILGYFLLLLFVFLFDLGMSVFVLCPFFLWFSEIPLPIPYSGYLNFPFFNFGILPWSLDLGAVYGCAARSYGGNVNLEDKGMGG